MIFQASDNEFLAKNYPKQVKITNTDYDLFQTMFGFIFDVRCQKKYYQGLFHLFSSNLISNLTFFHHKSPKWSILGQKIVKIDIFDHFRNLKRLFIAMNRSLIAIRSNMMRNLTQLGRSYRLKAIACRIFQTTLTSHLISTQMIYLY